ncbi:MAG: PEP/pyruvate-binding domain-containing protein, partial [Bacteroidota bacterium]|nr:PEP/pyruvate-binding domain-containing protein [Bacteroidota bacterium]
IISDVSFMRGDKKDTTAGMAFCKMVREEDKQMPFLLQSANPECEQYANDLNVGFINKYSKTLSIELKNYILHHFGFGDLIFRDPITHQEIGRAKDLPSLQQLILTIPDRTLLYHTSRNHISKWLNARALFPIARMFKYLQAEDFENLDELRLFVDKTISRYRLSKGRGVIAKFDRSNFNEYLIFSRIGEGSIGGKARGLAFINNIIKKYKLYNKYEDVLITIPQTIVLSTDAFDEFMESNNLYPVAMSNISDEEILHHFIHAKLSQSIQQDLYAYISVVENPIAVRSSSKLEDSHYQPFAGIYSTYMVPNIRADKALTIKLLCNAIKSVYASVFYKSSKAYITATSNAIDEEKMGIVLQEVCGTRYGNHFYPTISGVARSINFYPIGVEKLEEGTVSIAFGLGRFIVEGGNSLRFSPRYPQKVLQLSTPEMVLKQTQKQFYALDLSPEKFIPSTDDGINLMKLSINEALNDKSFKMVTSTYDFQNNMIRESSDAIGKKVVTFSKILNHETFPLAKIISELMEIGQKEMNNPIEIEFAVNLDVDPGEPRLFNFLQIRPIVENDQHIVVKIDEVPREETIIYSTSALGNGSIENIRDFIYVKPETFNPADNKQIALEIEKLNEQFVANETNYVLVGPGRWGSRDPWLGIPINWVQISQARVIVESGLRNFRIDPSQGTHFFQNLTSFRVGYFTINPYINEGYYDVDFLNQLPACYENDHLRHISFEKPLKILIDGRKNMGVIFKPTV